MSKTNKVDQSTLEVCALAVVHFISEHKKKFIGGVVALLLLLAAGVSFAIYYDAHENEVLISYSEILKDYSTMLQDEEKSVEAVDYALTEVVALTERAKWGYVSDNGYFLAGGIAFHNKRFDQALEFYTKFVEESPKSDFAPFAKVQIAVCYEWVGKQEEAFNQYVLLETELRDTKFEEQVLYDLGRLYQQKGEVEKAKEYFQRVLAEFSGSYYEKQVKKRLTLINYVDTTASN